MEGGQKNVDELEKTQPLGTLIRWLQFDFQLKLCCRGVQLEGGVYELAYTPGDFHMEYGPPGRRRKIIIFHTIKLQVPCQPSGVYMFICLFWGEVVGMLQ